MKQKLFDACTREPVALPYDNYISCTNRWARGTGGGKGGVNWIDLTSMLSVRNNGRSAMGLYEMQLVMVLSVTPLCYPSTNQAAWKCNSTYLTQHEKHSFARAWYVRALFGIITIRTNINQIIQFRIDCTSLKTMTNRMAIKLFSIEGYN